MNTDNPLFTFYELQNFTCGTWKNINTFSDRSVKHITTDTRDDCSNSLFVALKGENFDAHDFIVNAIKAGAAALCLEEDRYDIKSLPENFPVLEVSNTLTAYQHLAQNHRKRLKDLTLIAITGSNGKTSTKEILKNILSQEFGSKVVYATAANTNNHIGVPLNILNLKDYHKFAIIEMGTNHPGELDVIASIASPDIAVITSIGPSHLEFFKDINGVAKEKSSILDHFNTMQPNRLAVLPLDTLKYDVIRSKLKSVNYITYGEHTSDITFELILNEMGSTSFYINWVKEKEKQHVKWTIPGTHQIFNALASTAVASHLGLAPQRIADHLKSSTLTGMRMRIKKFNDNTYWVNDAYNANPTSTKAGLEYISEVIKQNNFNKSYIILGDMLELGKDSIKYHIDIILFAQKLLPDSTIISVGNIMNQISILEKDIQHLPETIFMQNSEQASKYINKVLRENDLVYLKGSRGMKLEKIEQNYTRGY